MGKFKVGDRVYIPSPHSDIVEATIFSIDENNDRVELRNLVAKQSGYMLCPLHTIAHLKNESNESRKIKFCPYCGKKIDIKE